MNSRTKTHVIGSKLRSLWAWQLTDLREQLHYRYTFRNMISEFFMTGQGSIYVVIRADYNTTLLRASATASHPRFRGAVIALE